MRTTAYLIGFILLSITNIFGQDSLLVGQKYYEDQIYIGLTYNILTHKPQSLQQKGISTGFHLGFIKDIPLNKEGTFALGIGSGYCYSNYSQNLKIQNETPEYILIENEDYKNKFDTHAVEFPFEIRVFRSSSATISKFLRIYLGGKISYIFHSKSKYSSSDETIKIRPLPYVNKWQYGPYIVVGWGTWNFYSSYEISSIFSNAPISDTINPNQIKSFKIGIQFYVF